MEPKYLSEEMIIHPQSSSDEVIVSLGLHENPPKTTQIWSVYLDQLASYINKYTVVFQVPIYLEPSSQYIG